MSSAAQSSPSFSEAERDVCLRDALAYVLITLARMDPSTSVGFIARGPISQLLDVPFPAAKYGFIDANGPEPWATFVPRKGAPDVTFRDLLLDRLGYALRHGAEPGAEPTRQLDLLLEAKGDHSIARIFSREAASSAWTIDSGPSATLWESRPIDSDQVPRVHRTPLEGGLLELALCQEHYDEELEVEVWQVLATWTDDRNSVVGRARGYLVHSEHDDQPIDGGEVYDTVTWHSDELGNLAYAYLRDRQQRGSVDQYDVIFFLADWEIQPPSWTIDTTKAERFLTAVVSSLANEVAFSHLAFDVTPGDYMKGLPIGFARAFGLCDETGMVANKYLMQQRVYRSIAAATVAEPWPVMPSYEQGGIPDLMRLADVCQTIPHLKALSLPVQKMAPPAPATYSSRQ